MDVDIRKLLVIGNVDVTCFPTVMRSATRFSPIPAGFDLLDAGACESQGATWSGVAFAVDPMIGHVPRG